MRQETPQRFHQIYMADSLKLSITKQQISTMPKATFGGSITVVDTPGRAAEAVDVLMHERVIGFDTETKPSFKKGHTNKVALMQLSTLDQCFLFRLNIIGIGPELTKLLESDDITKIGLSIHDDFNVMHRSSKVQPKAFVELQTFVKDYSITDTSLQKIFAIIFGKRISKSQRLTNWEAPALTPQQQSYAATDAWACLMIYNSLTRGTFRPELSQFIAPPSPPVTEK